MSENLHFYFVLKSKLIHFQAEVINMQMNMLGDLAIMSNLGIKPNFAAIGRKYSMDWRTVKKYYQGYRGKPAVRTKTSRLDQYKDEIADKLKIKRLTVRGVYEFMVNKHGIDNIGSYSNFNRYIKINKLKPKEANIGHPRYETPIGKQAQVDWKEDITLSSRQGKNFVVNIFHIVLSYSRYSYIELSVQKRMDDVTRCLINGFEKFGGVPEEILFDNMSTVANIHNEKKPTDSIRTLAKDFGFKIRFCKVRSPETKGTVEARNKILDWIRAYNNEFNNIEELVEIVSKINSDMNITINEETQISPIALFYKEKEYLQPLPNRQVIDSYAIPIKYKVSNESLIYYEGHKYSVNPELIGEDVTVENLDQKLFVYYRGKLVTVHPVAAKPVNYIPEHYQALMAGKVHPDDLDRVVKDNLLAMDKLLENRKINVSPIEASKSAEALIAFVNQSEYGKWVINYFVHLSATDRIEFIKGMNSVLPYVKNKDLFISHIKYSMKSNLCRTMAFDCLINDLMAYSDEECILTDEGYEYFKTKYDKELTEFINDLKETTKDE